MTFSKCELEEQPRPKPFGGKNIPEGKWKIKKKRHDSGMSLVGLREKHGSGSSMLEGKVSKEDRSSSRVRILVCCLSPKSL